MDWLKNSTKVVGSGKTGPDGFLYSPDDPFAAEYAAIDELLAETARTRDYWNIKLKTLQTAPALLERSPDQQLRLLLAAFQRLRTLQTSAGSWNVSHEVTCAIYTLRPLISSLLRRKLPFDEDALLTLLDLAASPLGAFWAYNDSVAGVLAVVERYAQEQPLSSEIQQAVQKLKNVKMTEAHREGRTTESERLKVRFDALLGRKKGRQLEPGEAWVQAVEATLSNAGPRAIPWQALLQHAFEITGSKPTRPWLKKAAELIERIGPEAFVEAIGAWFPLVGQPGRPRLADMHGIDTQTLLNPGNAEALKGFVWAAGTMSSAGEGTGRAVARLIGDLAEVCFKKIPNFGARCPKVGNACLAVLGSMNDSEAIAQLSRLRLKLKMPSMRRLLDKAVAAAGRQRGMSPADLEEVSVPTYGLTAPGELRRPLGEFTARLEVCGGDQFELKWLTAAGKEQTSVPAKVKQDHAEELKDLQRAVKDIRRILPAQAARIERLLAQEREWDVSAWRERYVDHPLIAPIARRLIWQFSPGSAGIWHDGRLVDAEERELSLAGDARVRLWQPITAAPDATLAWRQWLERHEVTQPIKQAHREVYLLTDAERQTHTYSNRFAGHILRQHQFTALCQQRGWTYRLQSAHFDAANMPTLALPWCDLRVEFWVEVVEGGEVSGHFISMHVSTDQVRFYRGQSPEPMPVEQVPALVFSEVMRDVDLFVAVCSVGNDPHWRDAGDQRNFGAYWQDYSFGELTESARTRRQVLDTLLPRLKIASRCSLTERFLMVRGDRRTYKIHLGSGNILMEPNDQYLCIVPGRSSRTVNVYLPFEGDNMLAVILSKAFLLAADTKITDPTILSQIGSK